MRTFARQLDVSQPTTLAKPAVLNRGSILDLQGTIGNRALGRMLQRKTDEISPAPGKADDPVEEALREANSKPDQPRDPEPILPGHPGQQARAIPKVYPDELWALPRIQDGLRAVAEETEAREKATLKPGETGHRTVANQFAYWEQRFIDSVDYILYRREGGQQALLRRELRAQEELLMQSSPMVRSKNNPPPRNTPEMFRDMGRLVELNAKVEALRRTYSERWKEFVDRTADRFVTLVSHHSRFLTVSQAAKPVAVYGLPAFEREFEVADQPKVLAEKSTPVAESVITFWKAVQDESGLKTTMIGNYDNHEKHSPYLGNMQEIGKYSFDVHLPFKINAEGFYEREPLIQFFLAVERASKAKDIAWIALYNDFEVAKRVNESLNKRRIGFSGMGSTKDDPGSIHHGPSPYLLHIHFNIMPIALAGQYLANKNKKLPYIDLGKVE